MALNLNTIHNSPRGKACEIDKMLLQKKAAFTGQLWRKFKKERFANRNGIILEIIQVR